MPDALYSLDAHFEALLAAEFPLMNLGPVPPFIPPLTIDGACSFCHDRVTGRGADIFEALAAAEVDHFEATKCRGEPVEVSCRVPKRLPWRPLKDFGMSKVDDRSFDEHLAAATAALDHKTPPWSKIKKRPPPPPAHARTK